MLPFHYILIFSSVTTQCCTVTPSIMFDWIIPFWCWGQHTGVHVLTVWCQPTSWEDLHSSDFFAGVLVHLGWHGFRLESLPWSPSPGLWQVRGFGWIWLPVWLPRSAVGCMQFDSELWRWLVPQQGFMQMTWMLGPEECTEYCSTTEQGAMTSWTVHENSLSGSPTMVNTGSGVATLLVDGCRCR